MQAITKVFSDIVKPYIDATDNGLIDNDFTNGAVNMLPNTASSATVNGVTFTVNDDNSISVSTTQSGASANTVFEIGRKKLPIGNYRLSGCPKDGSGTTYRLSFVKVGVAQITADNGNGADCLVDDATVNYAVNIVVYSSTILTTPKTFKPMITLADMPNSDYAHYVPYAMSNQELTSENQTLKNQIAQSSDEYSSSRAYKVGELCIYNNTLYKCITACSAAAWSVNQSCFTEDTLTNVLSEINLDIELISTKTALTTAGVIINIPNLDNYKEIYFYSAADDNDMSFGQTIIPTKLAKTFKYGFMSASSASGNYSFLTTIQYRGNNNFLIGYSALQGFSTPYIVIYGIH